MRTLKYLITAAMATSIAFSSCTKEITAPDETGQEDEQLSQEPGEPIVFEVSTGYDNGPDTPETKADFSGATFTIGRKKIERIDWESGDRLEIFCPDANPRSPLRAEYEISSSPLSLGSKSSAHISPVGDYLRWGNKREHSIYAVYPKLLKKGSNNNNKILSQQYSNNQCILTAEVPQIQGQNNKPIMIAAKEVIRGDRVNLDFEPVVNTFDISIKNTRNETVNLTEVELVSTSGALSGKYFINLSYLIPPVTESDRLYHFNNPVLEEKRVKHIFNSAYALAPNQSCKVRLYTLPVDIKQLTLVLHFGEEKMSLELKNPQGNWITFNKEKKYNFNDIPIPQSADMFNYTFSTSADTLYFLPFIYNYPAPRFGAQSLNDIHVESYRKNADGSKDEAVPFKYDSADWLQNSYGFYPSHPSNQTNIHNNNLSLSIKEFDPEDNATHTRQKNNLLSKPILSDYDLSTNGGTYSRNTANCYVVRQRGTYKFPAVCGNIIKDGNRNLAACRATPHPYDTEAPNNVLREFVDGTGREISSLFQFTYYLGASTVSLVWEDTKGLIERLYLSDEVDMQYVHFKIGENIDYGNALIAAKDNAGKIIWTWHIWVTDAAFKIRDEDFLSVPLGYRPELEDKPADIRSFVLKQDDIKGKSKTLQTKVIKGYTYPSCLYYTSGMMRPLIPTYRLYYSSELNGNKSNKTSIAKCYTGDFNANGERLNTYEFRFKERRTTLSLNQAINSPSKIFNLERRYWNLWNNKIIAKMYLNQSPPLVGQNWRMEKTVYDPCPVGYRVPIKYQLHSLPNETKERFKMGHYQIDIFEIQDRGWMIEIDKFAEKCHLLADWGDNVPNEPFSTKPGECPIIPVRDVSSAIITP